MSTIKPEVTFEVTDVQSFPPLPLIPYHEAVAGVLGSRVEACSQYHGNLIQPGRVNPLINALHMAFMNHYPVRLSPDIIWIILSQGLAMHINANAESLRSQFVQHNGQLQIDVRRDGFIKGSHGNDWPGVFAEISSVIKKHIGRSHELILADFSTTGPVERAASEIVLLDAMQSYFRYVVWTACGIPAITLEGTVDDWRSISRRVQAFGRFGLNWWVEPLLPVLAEFENAVQGHITQDFWQSIYRYRVGWAVREAENDNSNKK